MLISSEELGEKERAGAEQGILLLCSKNQSVIAPRAQTTRQQVRHCIVVFCSSVIQIQ